MGIYSAEAAEVYKENIFNPDAAGLLEFSINSQRAEQHMFETMIEMDFCEYYMESGKLVLTEGEKMDAFKAGAKKIWDKIIEAISKLIETLDKFQIKVRAWIKARINSNKAIVKKYPNLDLAAAKAKLSGEETVEMLDFTKANKIKDTLVTLTGCYDKIKDDYKKSFANSSPDTYKSRTDELVKSASDFFNKTKLADLNNTDDISKYIKSEKGLEELTVAVTGNVDDAIKKLKTTRESLKKAAKNKDRSESDRQEDAAAYKFVSVINSCISRCVNFGTRVAMKAMANYKTAYVKIAMAGASQNKADEKVANKTEKKEEVQQNSATIEDVFDYDAMLEYAIEINDQIVYDESFA